MGKGLYTNKRHQKPKIVFIDWNGTLSSSKFWGHLDDSSHPQNHVYQKTQSTLFGSHKHLVDPWMRGESTSEEIISQIANITGINYQLLLDEFIESCQNMQLDIANLADYIYKIRKSGIEVVIATDNMDSFPRWTVPALSLNNIFDGILDSYTLKSMKRDFDSSGNSLFFDNYLKANNILPEECILIDDSFDKDDKLSSYGLTYRQIQPITGLKTELDFLINNCN